MTIAVQRRGSGRVRHTSTAEEDCQGAAARGTSCTNAAGTAESAQIAASVTAVEEGARWAIIQAMSAPPTAVPAKVPCGLPAEAAPRCESGTVSAIIARTAELLVATAACATKSAPV